MFLESVNRTASLRAMMPTRGGADFSAVRDSAGARARGAADAAGNVPETFPGDAGNARRETGAPVRVMEMTRD